MQRFTELLLLLVACALPLLFVNGLEALQPAIKNSLQTYAIIRGLLVPRQFFCNSGFVCESSFCCNVNWHCCVDGSCCRPQTYCDLGTNGVIGCCPNGELCSGPAPTDNNPPPPPPPTPLPPPPPVTTTQPAPTSISSSTSTTTFTTLVGGPTQSAENQIIEVSVLDVNVNWSENWVLQTSSCDPSIKSKITSTGNSFFTYIFNATLIDFFTYYINVANSNTEWEVFVNGVSQNTYSSSSRGFNNCTYLNGIYLIQFGNSLNLNFTLMVLGSESGPSDPWSLEVNMLLIQEQDSASSTDSASSSTQNTDTPMLKSGAGRAQPSISLLVPCSIFLAAAISILRF